MADWRATLEQLLLLLERSKSPRGRTEAALELVALAEGHPERYAELEPAVPRLLASKQEELRRVGVRLAALVLEEKDAESLLTSRLADPGALVRMEATGQLADLALPSSRGALAAALEDAAYEVRFEAARGMAALKHPAGLDVLLEALDQGDFRFRALGALGELGDARALEPVRRVFRRWLLNMFERTSAAAVMARLGDPEGARYLVQRTRVRKAPDRQMAIELCGEVQVEGGREKLLEILRDRKDPARGAAARGLGRYRDPSLEAELSRVLDEGSLGDDLVLDVAEGLLFLGGEPARQRAAEAAEKLASDAAREELRMMLEENP